MAWRDRRGAVAVTWVVSAVGLSACSQETPPAEPTTDGSSGSVINLDDTGAKLDLGGADSTVTGTGFNPDSVTGGCNEITVEVTPTTPTLLLLVDQSGSMDEDFNGVTRWDAIYDTLMDPQTGVVPQLESQVRFGLALYTSIDGFRGGECPMLVEVTPALDNYAAIDATFAPQGPLGETPTGESLSAVAQTLAAFPERGPKGIVLATDGEPDTCAEPNPQNGQEESIAGAMAAWDLGIRTFVLSVGPEVAEEHLQDMANVGAGKPIDDPAPAPYWQALDPDELVLAFEEIVGSFVSCQLAVNGMVDLDAACEGTVTLDGNTLECGTDWQMIDEMNLELIGTACDTLQDGGNHQVSASWPCGVVVIP